MWIYELLPEFNQCTIDTNRTDFEAVVWPWISAILTSYTPLLIIAILPFFLAQHTCNNSSSSTGIEYTPNLNTNLSLLTVWLSSTYVVLYLPVLIMNWIDYKKFIVDFEKLSRFTLAMSLVGLSANCYPAIVGVLVFVCVPAYRAVLREAFVPLMSCCRTSKDTATVSVESYRRKTSFLLTTETAL